MSTENFCAQSGMKNLPAQGLPCVGGFAVPISKLYVKEVGLMLKELPNFD